MNLSVYWGQDENGWQRMKWLPGIIDSVDMNLSKVQETVKDSEAWHAGVHEDMARESKQQQRRPSSPKQPS